MNIENRYFRGLLWLTVALVGAYALWSTGSYAYVERWAGALFKAATGVWGGYRVSKGVCRIDPSLGTDGYERGMLHLARAIIVTGMVLAICLAI